MIAALSWMTLLDRHFDAIAWLIFGLALVLALLFSPEPRDDDRCTEDVPDDHLEHG
jgi:hypothetical protein